MSLRNLSPMKKSAETRHGAAIKASPTAHVLAQKESAKNRFFFGLALGVAVKDKDVWSSSLEKYMDRNGRLGAMIWGGVANETINLNEDTLWTGTPGDYTDPDAPNTLSKVRKLVDDGQYAEATAAAVNLSGNPSDVYQLLGDIKIEFSDTHAAYDEESYQRVLDLDTATVKVQYSANEVEYTREYFTSNPDEVVVIKISGNKPSCRRIAPKVYGNGNPKGSSPQKSIKNPNPKGIQYSAVLDLQISDDAGELQVVNGRKLRVEGGNWAVIRLTASSSFDGPFTKPVDSKKDPRSESLSTMDSAKRYSYSDLYARHVDDYQALFHRVSLQLSNSPKSAVGNSINVKEGKDELITTAQRVKSFKTYEDPSMVELLFQYGRYLLIACSRPGSQPSNLQGIWNKDIEPAWDGAPHLNINLQMNYWPSLSCNLKECQEPLFDYISSLSRNGNKTAKVNYGASGWVAHQVSDIWAKTSPDRGQAVWALWQMGGAWLCTHLWEHYTYTMDREFLRNKAYPLLEGCAAFLLDWLIEGPRGILETNPSTSPEHIFTAPDGKPASVSYSSAMDMQIIQEVFSAIVSAAEELGKSNDDLIVRIRKAQPHLAPTRIARDGSIMEWAQEFEDPEVHHRHLSHLFGLFPGRTINLEMTPDLCKAAENTLNKRGEEGPGWSTTWKAALWARLHNSEHAYRMVKHLFDLVDPNHESDFEGGLYANLFTAHPPFQIDANFGFSAAVAEMLVQSTVKDLYLLPALPRDKWPNGCVKGLKARGGVTVSVCWSEGDLEEVGLWSNDGNTVKRSLISTSRASAFRSSPPLSAPRPLRPPSVSSSRVNPRRLSFSNPRTLGELGCIQSIMPLHTMLAGARLTSHLAVNVRAFCELSHGTFRRSCQDR
ncbi:UNVERIFIED_CONTAM: Alpha-L-fucosidase 2 [Sesamum calycinum]|uniref:Alpha-L-fucosidase 2 n=1 Tax=Sesamum calycinum TaxID=2727403 RepID=A0AAW2PKX3_9LAMI